jgi:hypothetical protein
VKMDLRGRTLPARPHPPRQSGRVIPKKGGDPVAGGSWWAARAKAGEVTAGFTRQEIMRPEKEDPRAEGGLYGRVGGLLRELSDGNR